MYKYVFCDLDATLFDDDKNISDKNYEAINKCNENGSRFFICTGRVPYCIDGYVGNVPYSVKPDTYKTMGRLSETIAVKMIYYTKTKTGLTIEIED